MPVGLECLEIGVTTWVSRESVEFPAVVEDVVGQDMRVMAVLDEGVVLEVIVVVAWVFECGVPAVVDAFGLNSQT
ncbi:hypothetical protein HLB23_40225 [Nocardia uniformis]|uniref:Uncharacterized protein n=1 Tax=Nocardia uniformis TaxID=53432 RepID=A0A849CGC1_9NOCA|nr:hypothetical protein [Nocardia uniformis]NNH76010.1 hypothetical protein [Nocardia uniformis]